MNAGLDFGTSLVKAVWKNNDYRFCSTADCSLEELARCLKSDGVQKIQVAGIGFSEERSPYFADFEQKRAEGNPIENEIQMQAAGTRHLLQEEQQPVKDFLLISIGTGTSYTIITDDKAVKFPLGNSISGGFIRGLGTLLGAESYQEIVIRAAKGTPLDLRVKDQLPQTAGSLEGELVIANFGRAQGDSEKNDAYATLISTVVVATLRDILHIGMTPHFSAPEDVVYVGSTVARMPPLKNLLQLYTSVIGKKPHFLEHGEYALAMGAYHQLE